MARRDESLDRFAEAAPKRSAKVPFDFVLEELRALAPTTRPMFGCTAVYVGEKIVMALREKPGDLQDNGVWLATTEAHHTSLQKDFPAMRSIAVFGGTVSGWQVLPAESDDFEDAALRACAMVRAGDARIGKVPKPKRAKTPAVPKKSPAKKSSAAKKSPAKKSPAKKR